MKRQISNEQTRIAQIIFSIFCFTLSCFAMTFLVSDFFAFRRLLILCLSILCSLISLYYSGKLYSVSFDNDFIYLSCLRQIKKLGVEKITDITPYVIPFRLFYRNVYLIKLTYFDNDTCNKIYFLSKGTTGRVGTVNNIPMLDTLRQLMRDKKYSR